MEPVYTPVIGFGQTIGYVAAEYSYQTLFRNLTMSMKLAEAYHVSVGIANEPIFSLAGAAGQLGRVPDEVFLVDQLNVGAHGGSGSALTT